MPEQRIGSYIIEEQIGRGGMGVVHKGRHARLPRVVAVKSIDPHVRRDLRRLRHRFEREAFVQSQLDHPSVVKVYDYIVSEQTYHIVMEFVEGSSLADLLGRQRGGRLPVERALDLFEQMLAAIAYAHCFVYRDEEGATHRGMTHRDLKPPNILVTPDDRVKVTDFGIVKLAGASESDTSGLLYGSPDYVSPEQATGAYVDQRSDIYSLGVILYEMLTGTTPFAGGEKTRRTDVLRAHVETPPRPPAELDPEIAHDLDAAILRALEKKPERRFDTAFDFWRAIRHARGRDTADIDELERTLHAEPAREGPDTGRIPHVTAEMARAHYTTQPMTDAFCEACGEEVRSGDAACRACGTDLRASPATRNLARGAGRGLSRRVLWPVLIAVAAAGALIGYLVVRQTGREEPPPSGVRERAPTPAEERTQTNAAAPPAADAPRDGAVLLRPSRVSVDSSFEGYNERPLTDGVTDVRQVAALRYNRGNWVSAETAEEHWVQLDFEPAVRVTTVYVFWGFDRSRYMPSRRARLEAAGADGAWRQISELEPGENFDRTAFEFAPFEARSLRVLQPAQQGPTGRPFVMWLREVQVFGLQR